MALPFKIPKKKNSAGSDSAHSHQLSPLSRLQSSAPQAKGYGDPLGRGGANRMHAGNAVGSSSDRLRLVRRPPSGRSGLCSTDADPDRGGPSAANHKSPGSWSCQSQPRWTAGTSTNGWRPKRASDRLLQPSERLSPPQKKQSAASSAAPSSWTRSISVEAVDSLAELRAPEHAGSLSSSVSFRRTDSNRDAAEGKSDAGKPQKKKSAGSGPEDTSEEEDFVSRMGPSAGTPSSSVSEGKALCSASPTPGRRRSLSEDVMETQRDRWRQFREGKNRSAALHPRPKKPKQTPNEPIVLSSEEEDGEQHEDEAKSDGKLGDGGNSKKLQVSKQLPPPLTPPSFLQLEFVSLHAGLVSADANGPMTITANCITLPVKGDEEGEVSVVASQLRGYGVWDGGVAEGGTLLAGWEGPAPSLLFLWVSDAQASLLQKELSAIRTSAAIGPLCSVLLLVLTEQLQEIRAALMFSILDMKEYQQGRSSSSAPGGPSSPVGWADGLLLVHGCPPPVDQHLLRLLGRSSETSCQLSSGPKKKCGQQQLPSRLLRYPLAPGKGRITVTTEDLACLDAGEFLNDVIIDFYLKYLLLEGVGGPVAQRSHVFSSFFFKQLSRRRAAGEDGAPSVPDRHVRHQRVKTWTRHQDIFTKDFLFVPVNQEAHWFLVVVCFPGLDGLRHRDFQSPAGGSERAAGKPSIGLRSQQPPECSQQGSQRSRVMQRPCILVMDSLKLSYHENVCRLLRDYLQVEWEVRRKTTRLFTPDTIRSSCCRVPQQDNSSDCGLYLLQYAESFLQNPIVHFDLPLRLENWFPRQRARQKREEIRRLIMMLQRRQLTEDGEAPPP
ncbi:sentrin-specific protease 7b isoform 3-T5 [Odontesthes bonariensis]|uniref:sentrin-specific protease 7b isoform X3 n=1 Tax=Odontesthes bonariensis TaxID=219752 RepID=UPI003F58E074